MAYKIRAKPTEGAQVYCNHFRGQERKSGVISPAVVQTNIPNEDKMTKAAHRYRDEGDGPSWAMVKINRKTITTIRKREKEKNDECKQNEII